RLTPSITGPARRQSEIMEELRWAGSGACASSAAYPTATLFFDDGPHHATFRRVDPHSRPPRILLCRIDPVPSHPFRFTLVASPLKRPQLGHNAGIRTSDDFLSSKRELANGSSRFEALVQYDKLIAPLALLIDTFDGFERYLLTRTRGRSQRHAQ